MKTKIRNALISVTDKSNLLPILKILKKFKINILSSGGTYKIIRKLDLNVRKYLILQISMKC